MMGRASGSLSFGLLLVIWVGIEVKVALAATEVLKNADFEYTVLTRDWHCNQCTMTSSRDSYHNYHSAKVTNRQHHYSGPAQNVQVTPDANYRFVAFIKILDLPSGAMYDTAELMMACNTPAKPHGAYTQFGTVPFIQRGVWTELGGIQRVPHGAHSCRVYVQTKQAGTNYVIDQMSLQKFPDDPNWLSEANARIDKIRKADITVTVNGPQSEHYDVEVKQTKHEFAFGTAVGASQFVDPAYKKYHDFILNNFEWAVLENALKWPQLEHTHNHVDFSKALAAITSLRNGGIKVRGHNLVWGVQRHCPTWLQHMSDAQVKTEMEQHIADTVRKTKGLVEHWDVNNENLHGDFFEQKTHDPNVTIKMFRQAHAVDPHVKLFLNDYSIMDGSYAMAMRDQAKLFHDAGVPVYGVGIQSHIHSFNPNMAVYKNKLDTVAEAGLPIWITELTVKASDANAKATALKNLLTLYFSHPAVEGVLLWGFWDGKIFDKSVALFEGSNLTANAAGRAYQTLFHSTWRTDEHHTVGGQGTVKVRGFRGQYQLIVKHGGKQIAQKTFTLHAAGKSVHVNVEAGGASIIVG